MPYRGNTGARVADLANTVQLRFYTGLPDQLAINVFHFRMTMIAGLGPSLVDVLIKADADYAAPWKACITASATFLGFSAQWLRPLPISAPAFSDESVGLCTLAGDVLPSQVTGLVTWRTAGAGRAMRGRTYFPFPTESRNTASGLPDAAYLTALNTFATAVVLGGAVGGGGNTAEIQPVVYHKATGTVTPVTTFSVRSRWGTQRRRGSSGRQNPPVLPG